MFAPQKDWAENRKTTTAMGQSAALLARLQLLPASLLLSLAMCCSSSSSLATHLLLSPSRRYARDWKPSSVFPL